MTKENWAKVEKALSGLVGEVVLLADGRKVTFQRGPGGKNRLIIATYIDGAFRGEWCNPKKETPETRYMRPVAKFVWAAESRRRMKKMSKRKLKQLGYDPDEKIHYFHPLWPNATAIRRHYQKTFSSIELVSVSGVSA